eukprot:gnl/Trimastix_PCT/3948.p1 GENE.gnl/Trimastix_PCT/3948~~gnl/Trimastix_PCT/3948.p1  ORF type:complete len:297 (-),score=38.28 gnl/Trimastix_PCT/3948:14-904(-)
MKAIFLCILALFVFTLSHESRDAMPCPFRRILYYYPQASRLQHGNDVIILQNLLSRSSACAHVPQTGMYDRATQDAVRAFQRYHRVGAADGVFEEATAHCLLRHHMRDGYRDPSPEGEVLMAPYLYKIHIPLQQDRNIEANATLYDRWGRPRHTFPARCHGSNRGTHGTAGRNQLCNSGNTPTGRMRIDLNSPEGDPLHYGPYPINRVVDGLAGNAQFLLPHIRNGILLHTGQWPHWHAPLPMPNSLGCIHAYPEDIRTIWRVLTRDLGVVVHNNTFGHMPYPYPTQGILTIQEPQ